MKTVYGGIGSKQIVWKTTLLLNLLETSDTIIALKTRFSRQRKWWAVLWRNPCIDSHILYRNKREYIILQKNNLSLGGGWGPNSVTPCYFYSL